MISSLNRYRHVQRVGERLQPCLGCEVAHVIGCHLPNGDRLPTTGWKSTNAFDAHRDIVRLVVKRERDCFIDSRP